MAEIKARYFGECPLAPGTTIWVLESRDAGDVITLVRFTDQSEVYWCGSHYGGKVEPKRDYFTRQKPQKYEIKHTKVDSFNNETSFQLIEKGEEDDSLPDWIRSVQELFDNPADFRD